LGKAEKPVMEVFGRQWRAVRVCLIAGVLVGGVWILVDGLSGQMGRAPRRGEHLAELGNKNRSRTPENRSAAVSKLAPHKKKPGDSPPISRAEVQRQLEDAPNWRERLQRGTEEDVEAVVKELLEEGSPSVPELVDALRLAFEYGTEARFAPRLLGSSRPEVVVALTAFLETEDLRGRRGEAARYLQAVRNPAVNGLLLDGLERFAAESDVAPHFRDALARNADAAALERIVHKLKSEGVPFEERSYLLGAIARIDSEAAVPALVKILDDAAEAGFELHVLLPLARIASVDALAALIDYGERTGATVSSPICGVISSLRVKGESLDYLLGRARRTTNEAIRDAITKAVEGSRG
jgi:hypothetical protein